MGRFIIPALFILSVSFTALNVSADDYPHPYAKPSDTPPASLSNEGGSKTMAEIINGGPITNPGATATSPSSAGTPSIKMTITNNAQPGSKTAECNFDDFIGRPVKEVTENARFLGRQIRILGEDDMVTMEYLEGRVNLITNKAGIITSITCG